MDIKARIEQFKTQLTQADSKTRIATLLYHLCNNVSLPLSLRQWQHGEYLFRTYKVDNLLALQNVSQKNFEPTPAYLLLHYGRLNRPHEEMMYFSSNPKQALKETQAKTPVIVSAYRVRKNFASTEIGYTYDNEGRVELTPAELANTNAILQFFRSLFVDRDHAGLPVKYLNEVTTTIRDNFYDLPQTSAQAWSYPVAGCDEEDADDAAQDFCNLAMYPGVAKDLLEFAGAVVVSDSRDLDHPEVVYCFDDEYELNYLKDNPELKPIFGL